MKDNKFKIYYIGLQPDAAEIINGFIQTFFKFDSTMPFVKVYLHLVFTTKNSYPYLDTPEKRKMVWKHIKENSVDKGIFIDVVNGYSQHCHCLVSLGSEQTIAKAAQLIKGESSFWINKNKLTNEKFAWQSEYWAVSVSESIIPNVRKYILRQEEHHSKTSFADETKEFKDEYKIE